MNEIINALGGQEAYDALPVLDLGNRRGGTDYIDFLRGDDLTAPIMKGVDCFRRPFVSFRYAYAEDDYKTQYVETFFQRYTDGTLWVPGGNGELSMGTNIVSSNDAKMQVLYGRLKRIINGSTNNRITCAYNLFKPTDPELFQLDEKTRDESGLIYHELKYVQGLQGVKLV